MGEPLEGTRHVGPVRIRRKRTLAPAEHQVAAHPGGEVDDHVDAGSADALHRLPKQGRIACPASRLGVAHVEVHDGRPRPRRFDRGIGDLARGHRNGGMLVHRIAGAGDPRR